MNKRILNYIPWFFVFVSTVLISLLIVQNIRIKNQLVWYSKFKAGADKYLDAYRFEKNLGACFLFRKIPINTDVERFLMFRETVNVDNTFYDKYLFMVFDFTVCGKCLDYSFDMVTMFRDKFEEQMILPLAIVGISNKREESEILGFYRSGKMPIPFKTLEVEDLYRSFRLDLDNYIDTPFFILTTGALEVIEIFKPIYLDEKELGKWLDSITRKNCQRE